MHRVFAATALFLLALCTSAIAQVNSAIGGTVQDPSQALIPGVTVSAENTQTGVASSTITNESGAYNFAALIPGIYRVRASLPGFRTQTYNEVQLSAATPVRLNFTLEVGDVAQAVEVTVASDTLLRESSASVGEVLTEARVSALPVVGGNVLDLVRTLPGYRESTGGAALDTFAGAAASTLNTVRDGISVSDGRFNNGLFATTTINPDLVGEIRLILTPVDAEMGRGNAQVQITTRSGTNRYSGSGVWDVRNTALDPNTWANNRQVDPLTGKAPQRTWTNDHEYTLSFGGPIIRNKTFFYALWDHRLRKERETVNGIVLTDTARLGIFRYFDGWNPGNADATETLLSVAPTTTTRIARAVDALGNPIAPRFNANGTPYSGAGLQCLSVFGRQRLDASGNMVPFTAADCPGGTAILPPGAGTFWDPMRPVVDPTGYIFDAAIKDMPRANWFGANGTTDGLNTASIRWLRTSRSAGNTFGTSANDNRRQFNIKIDHNFSMNHKAAGSYTLERNDAATDRSNWPGGISGDAIRHPHVVSTNVTSTLGPTLVNEARFGFRGNYNQVRRPFETEDGQVLLDLVNRVKGGPDPGYTRNVGAIYPMQIEPTGGGNYGFGQANALYNRLAQHNGNTTRQFTYGDTLSWTRGEHAFKGGVEYRTQDSKGYTNLGTNPYPRLSTGAGAIPSPLRQGGTANLGAALTSVRTNLASLAYLLSGSVNLVTQAYWIDSFQDVQDAKWQSIVTSPDIFRTVQTNETSVFVKDDWKITKNLTLNLGVRWEYYGAAYIAEGFTTTPKGRGLGVLGVSRIGDGNVFDSWLVPGANPVFLSGYGRNAPNSAALQCTTGISQPNLPTSSCNPANLTELEFVGPGSPNRERTASPSDWNNFGPAIGFAYQVPESVPWFGQRSAVRGGYSITYSPTRNLSTVQGGFQDMYGSAPGATSALSTQSELSAQVPGYLDLRDIARIVPLRPISPAVPGGTLPIYSTSGSLRVYGFAPDYATPYVQNFNLSLTTSIRRNLSMDIRYVGTQSKKQTGDINLNLNNVYYNNEFYSALEEARNGGNPLLLTQMFAGVTLGNGATTPVGNRNASGVVVTGAAALRASTAYNENLRDGNYLAIAAALQAPVTPSGYVSGTPNGTTPTRRLIRNGCDRIATLGSTNYVSPTGDVTPLRCFPENYLIANPQLQPAGATTGGFYRTNSGFTNYHSVEAQLTLRPTHGFSAQTTYTWSKTLGVFADGNANPLVRRGDYARPYSSLTHDLRTNGVIELPLGPNKLLLGNSSGWLARIVERWQAAVILNLASGRPTSANALTALTYAAGGLTAPNTVADIVGPWEERTGNVKWDGPTNRGSFFGSPHPFLSVPDPQCEISQGWVTAQTSAGGANVDCNLRAVAREVSPGTPGAVTLSNGTTVQYLLVNPRPGKQGTLGQTTIEGPGTIRFDANLSKTIAIWENKSIQIRFDATNVLNHPNPPDPIFNINSEDFGYLTGNKTGNRAFEGQLRFTF